MKRKKTRATQRGPFILQHVETDSTQLVYVRVVYLRKESNLQSKRSGVAPRRSDQREMSMQCSPREMRKEHLLCLHTQKKTFERTMFWGAEKMARHLSGGSSHSLSCNES